MAQSSGMETDRYSVTLEDFLEFEQWLYDTLHWWDAYWLLMPVRAKLGFQALNKLTQDEWDKYGNTIIDTIWSDGQTVSTAIGEMNLLDLFNHWEQPADAATEAATLLQELIDLYGNQIPLDVVKEHFGSVDALPNPFSTGEWVIVTHDPSSGWLMPKEYHYAKHSSLDDSTPTEEDWEEVWQYLSPLNPDHVIGRKLVNSAGEIKYVDEADNETTIDEILELQNKIGTPTPFPEGGVLTESGLAELPSGELLAYDHVSGAWVPYKATEEELSTTEQFAELGVSPEQYAALANQGVFAGISPDGTGIVYKDMSGKVIATNSSELEAYLWIKEQDGLEQVGELTPWESEQLELEKSKFAWQQEQARLDREAAGVETPFEKAQREAWLAAQYAGEEDWITKWYMENMPATSPVAVEPKPILTPGEEGYGGEGVISVPQGVYEAATAADIPVGEPYYVQEGEEEEENALVSEYDLILQSLQEAEAAEQLQDLGMYGMTPEEDLARSAQIQAFGLDPNTLFRYSSPQVMPPPIGTPPAPSWLPEFVPGLETGQAIFPSRAKLPSGQTLSRLTPSELAGLSGYVDWSSGKTPGAWASPEDFMFETMRLLPTSVPRGTARWSPSPYRV